MKSSILVILFIHILLCYVQAYEEEELEDLDPHIEELDLPNTIEHANGKSIFKVDDFAIGWFYSNQELEECKEMKQGNSEQINTPTIGWIKYHENTRLIFFYDQGDCEQYTENNPNHVAVNIYTLTN